MSIWLPPGFHVPTVPEKDRYEGHELDANVLEVLPKGAVVKYVKTNPFCSFWAINSKVTLRLRDGSERLLFLKFYTVPGADEIARAEFEGSQTLFRALPDNATKPIAWGRCASRPGWAFFLAEFRDMMPMRPGLPAPAEVAAVVARLHEHRSPGGRFGFHVRTFAATQAIDTSCCDTWEEFFSRSLAAVLAAELAAQGRDPDLEALSAVLLDRVVPRLIRPLETGRNRIEPVLLHGDLWHGNLAVDNETKNVLLYDPCCFYGHRDYDFSQFKSPRNLAGKEHYEAYLNLVEQTHGLQVEDDPERYDLWTLYAIRSSLLVSTLWRDRKEMRQEAIKSMRYLTAKYGEACHGTRT
ncbi:hypothetical protein RB595_008331 [Gaeumannomyces hyphopodioides]